VTMAGMPAARGRFESVRAGGEDAADEFVGPFGGGDIEDTRYHAGLHERLHGLASGAHGGEDQDFVSGGLEAPPGVFDARGCVAELTGDDDGAVGCGWGVAFDHTADGPGGTGEDESGDAVEAGDIDDAGQHQRYPWCRHTGRSDRWREWRP
jgi:hypothetical protein